MSCRVCDSKDLDLAVDLGSQPWCNNIFEEIRGWERAIPPAA